MTNSKYEMICGIEIHVELNTNTKIFCDCSTTFGAPPNTQCCPVCSGMPGALPVLNEQVVDKAIMAGFATNCKVNHVSAFDRKNYFYPDLAKSYQVTQYYEPICCDGYVVLSGNRKIRINRIHIEEDAGKIINRDEDILVDYNRSGVPLIEIVSQADIKTPDEAREYVEKIQTIMRYIGISDCRMQEGSMRCDVNVSVKDKDSGLSSELVEIKNLNSKKFVYKAIKYELERQVKIISEGRKTERQTRGYSETENKTYLMRSKEKSEDYRYFREPDLERVILTDEKIEKVRKAMPENLEDRRRRYVCEFNIPEKDAETILKYRNAANFFDDAVCGVKDKKVISNLIIEVMLSKLGTESEKELFNTNVEPRDVSKLADLVEKNKISRSVAKNLLLSAIEKGESLKVLIRRSEEAKVDNAEILHVCESVIKENQGAVSDYASGKNNALKFLVGSAMKKLDRNVDARIVDKIMKGLLT